MSASLAHWLLAQEARALLVRLGKVKPFVLHQTMVPAAAIPLAAQARIERYLADGRKDLRRRVASYVAWLEGTGRHASPEEAQRRFAFLRLRFNAVLAHFDIFADVYTQRSQHETGVWLAGLDAVAADVLRLEGGHYRPPPVVCFLGKGHGAAIRRVSTRLPGGGVNPVAIIRLPRERMVGSGIASSLVHEVGHQASVLLDLQNSLQPLLRGLQRNGGEHAEAWRLYENWLSEILADFWAVARIGVAATQGLMGVLSLPRNFVFHLNLEDPHPFPWIRTHISCALGQALYSHPQWQALAELWSSLYPLRGLSPQRLRLIRSLQNCLPGLAELMLNHRPKRLNGASLAEALRVNARSPDRLAAHFQAWRADPERMKKAPPSLAFAVLGQARLHGAISPEEESRALADLLAWWAMRGALEGTETCAKAFNDKFSTSRLISTH